MSVRAVQLHHVHDFELRAPVGEANPFMTKAAATFTHDSGERTAGVPAFYDGDGTWKVRFRPRREGVWRGKTSSDVAGLDGIELGPVECVPNENALVHGQMGIDPERPRRFIFDDGSPCVPLGFECDWLFALRQSKPDSFRESVDLIAERGFNYLVTNVYAPTLGFSGSRAEWVFAPPDIYIFGGDNDSPDHSRLNVAFFRGYDGLMAYLFEKGIVAHVMIQVQNKHVRWPARRSAEDDLYWRYVVSRYAAFPNVVWDVGKESYNLLKETGSHEYTIDRIRLIRETDPYGHLVTVHDSEGDSAGRDSAADDECDFVADQVHLGEARAYHREAASRFRSGSKPYMNIEYGYEEGAERIETYTDSTTAPWRDVLKWTWAVYLGGGYPCYYYTNTAWDLVKFLPEPEGWKRYRYLRDFLGRFDLAAMAPESDCVAAGLCLAEPGRQYLVFLPGGGDLEIDLAAVPEGARLACEWMDICSGERATVEVEGNGSRTAVKNPLSGVSSACVVGLRRAGG